MIVVRVSGVNFTTNLAARYPFTSNGDDSTGNHDAPSPELGSGGGSAFSSNGARLIPNNNFKSGFGSHGTSTSLSTTLNNLSSTTGTISFWVKANTSYVEGGSAESKWVFGSSSTIGSPTLGAHFGYYDQQSDNDGGTGGWHFWSSPGSGSGYEGAVWQGDAGTDHVHIVLTVNGSAIRMYKDGEFADSYTATSGWPVGNYEWELNGQRGAFNTNFMFDGWFKDLSVWTNRVLTPHEVSVLYDLGHGGSY